MQTSSFFLGSCTTLFSVFSLLPSLAAAASSTTSSTYTLATSYAGSTFFNGFNFYSDADPTEGFVTYVNQSTALNTGLISASDGKPVYIGVDHTNKYNGRVGYSGINGVGRPSVRVESKATFNHALIIADLTNMPGGVCGTWPALWTLGDGEWPYSGEIDIIEGVNTNTQTLTSLHTGGQCNVPNAVARAGETGTFKSSNCTYSENNDDGCSVSDGDSQSYGLGFNANNGGVYVMERTSTSVKTWSFRRGAIPSDITAGTPNPANWGNPYANFAGNCNFDAQFVNHRIILDTTFCGGWAGSVWSDSCAASTGVKSCSVYVGNNPSAFKNMYWSINSIKVYQPSNSASSSTSSTSSSSLKTSSSVTSTTPSSSSSSVVSATRPSTSTTSSSTTLSTQTSSRSTTSLASVANAIIATTTPKVATTTKSTTTTTTTTATSKKRNHNRALDSEIGVEEHGYTPVRHRGISHRHFHERRHPAPEVQMAVA